MRGTGAPAAVVSLATTLAAFVACGDGAEPRAVEGPVVTDSAGVRIVTNPAEPPPVEYARVAAEPDLVIGELQGRTPYSFSSINDIELLPGGRIVVASGGGEQNIRVFGPDGRHLATVGRPGEGPGEFGDLFRVFAFRGDSLLVYDRGNARFSVFDGEYELARTFATAPGVDPIGLLWPQRVWDDGGIVLVRQAWRPSSARAGQAWERTEVVRLGAEGLMVDTLGTFDLYELGPSSASPWPVTVELGATGYHVARADGFGWVRSDRPEIRVFDREGSLTAIHRWKAEVIPVTDAIFEAFVRQTVARYGEGNESLKERVEDLTRSAPRAKAFPVVGYALTDALGYHWISDRTLPGEEPSGVYRVMSPEGRWVGTARLPDGLRLPRIGQAHLLAVWRDDLDIPYVRRYPLERMPSSPGGAP